MPSHQTGGNGRGGTRQDTDTALKLTASNLPIPPTVNSTSRQTSSIRQRRHFSSAQAKAWTDVAVPLMRLAGLKPLPPGRYDYRVVSTLYCGATRDCDSSSKLVLDAIKTAIAVDDRFCSEYVLRRVITRRRAEHRLDIEVLIAKVTP